MKSSRVTCFRECRRGLAAPGQQRQRTHRTELRGLVEDIAQGRDVARANDHEDASHAWTNDARQIVRHVEVAFVPLGEELRSAVVTILAGAEVAAEHPEGVTAVE